MNHSGWQEFGWDLFCRELAKSLTDHLPAFVLLSDTVKRLRDALNQMLPAGVAAGVDQITDQEVSFDYPEEEKQLAKALLKRRNEFITGRRCARKALEEIGFAPCALVSDENRAPRWPEGVTGSISHSVVLGCAVVAQTDTIACLGVDLETTTRISSRVIKRVVHPLERDYVGKDPVRGSLIFSVKEAFFKAQFPIWNAWPNFDDLAFQESNLAGQLSVLKVADHLPGRLRSAIEKMHFRYAFFENYVLTLCWLDKLPADGGNQRYSGKPGKR